MKSNAFVSALLAMSLSVGGPAFAQPSGNEYANDPDQIRLQRQIQRANEQQRQRDYVQQRQRGQWQQGRPGNQYRDGRGAGPDHQYYRGDRLSPEYRHRNYVVDDWRGHNLNAPPRGYHWVQVGGDYVLVAIATGIILQLLLNN